MKKILIAEREKNMNKSVELNEAASACDCTTCKEQGISCDTCEKCMTKSYQSDNEEEDNWDNMQKSCWKGYKQDGMKDKNGRQVPNCVPVKKSLFGTEGPQTLIPKNK